MHRILVVDDEVMITDLLYHHFSERGYGVLTANDAKTAMTKLDKNPELIILDINMPDVDGLTICKNIRNHINCPIVFLTARITENDIITGFATGGDDYITKPFSLPELTARVEAHLRRESRDSSRTRLAASNGIIIDLDAKKVYYNERIIEFSKREYDILEFFIEHQNQVFDKEHIYEAVWGFDAEGDSNVIKEHIRKIRTKLITTTGTDNIETVWGMGYRWVK